MNKSPIWALVLLVLSFSSQKVSSAEPVWITPIVHESFDLTPLSILRLEPIPYANQFNSVDDLSSLPLLAGLVKGMPAVTLYSLRDAYLAASSEIDLSKRDECNKVSGFYDKFWDELAADDGVLKRFHNLNAGFFSDLLKNEAIFLGESIYVDMLKKYTYEFMIESYMESVEYYISASLSIVIDGQPLWQSFVDNGLQYGHEMSWVVILSVAAYVANTNPDVYSYIHVMKCREQSSN